MRTIWIWVGAWGQGFRVRAGVWANFWWSFDAEVFDLGSIRARWALRESPSNYMNRRAPREGKCHKVPCGAGTGHVPCLARQLTHVFYPCEMYKIAHFVTGYTSRPTPFHAYANSLE